jgi:hypothetical protein
VPAVRANDLAQRYRHFVRGHAGDGCGGEGDHALADWLGQSRLDQVSAGVLAGNHDHVAVDALAVRHGSSVAPSSSKILVIMYSSR